MKSQFFLFLFFIHLFYSVQCQEWEWINPSPIGYNFTKIQALEEDQWILNTLSGVLLQTNDAGISWRASKFDHQSTANFFFLNKDIGWTSTSYRVGEIDYLYYLYSTKDGGNSWDLIYEEPERRFQSISFWDEDLGFMVIGDSLSQTKDGGLSWEKLFSIDQLPLSLSNEIKFLTDSIAIFFTKDFHYITNDRGQSWRKKDEGSVFDYYIKDTLTWWAIDPFLRKTDDGGQSFQDLETPAFNITSLIFEDDEIGWMVGKDSMDSVYFTEDGGESWEKKYSAILGLGNAALIEGKYAVVGDLGTIAQTENNGDSWEQILKSLITNNIYQIHHKNKEEAVILGDGIEILKTYNKGDTWETKYYPKVWGYFPVMTNVNNSIWVLDPNFEIHKSMDYGETWKKITIPGISNPIPQSPYDFSSGSGHFQFISENKGWITNHAGLMLRTNDGGETWAEIQSPLDSQICCNNIYFISEDIGWGSGVQKNGSDFGFLYKTTNGGDSWELINGEEKFHQIFFFNENLGFGFNGYTTDGGLSWNTLANKIPLDLYPLFIKSIHVFDENNWRAVVGNSFYNNFLFKTSDGGETWIEEPSIKTSWADELYFYNESFGWQFGGNVLLRYLDKSVETNEFNISNINLNIFPNPTNSHIAIKSNFEIEDVRIFNATGQVNQMIREINDTETNINLSNTDKGVLFIQVRGDNIVVTKRIVLE